MLHTLDLFSRLSAPPEYGGTQSTDIDDVGVLQPGRLRHTWAALFGGMAPLDGWTRG